MAKQPTKAGTTGQASATGKTGRRTIQANVKRAGLLFRCAILGEPVSRVADDLGVKRDTAYSWMREYRVEENQMPSIQEQVIDIYRTLALMQRHIKHGVSAHGPRQVRQADGTVVTNPSEDPQSHLAYIGKYFESIRAWSEFMPTVVGLVEGLKGVDLSNLGDGSGTGEEDHHPVTQGDELPVGDFKVISVAAGGENA